jgi:hypothetical protein
MLKKDENAGRVARDLRGRIETVWNFGGLDTQKSLLDHLRHLFQQLANSAVPALLW